MEEQGEIYQACRVIFGPQLVVSSEFLAYLQPAGLKSAFRRRVKETHPDGGNGSSPHDFWQVCQAYETLTSFLDRQACPEATVMGSVPRPAGGHRGRQRVKARQSGAGTAQLPSRPLLFGHFLCYSKVIDWQCLGRALIWHRRQRPRLGDLARTRGWLSAGQVETIASSGVHGKPFGQSALEKGLLSQGQLRSLLVAQGHGRAKIGRYFVDQKIISEGRLKSLLSRQCLHNTRFRRDL